MGQQTGGRPSWINHGGFTGRDWQGKVLRNRNDFINARFYSPESFLFTCLQIFLVILEGIDIKYENCLNNELFWSSMAD